MEPSYITIIMICLLLLERIFKRIKKSSCLGSSIEFNEVSQTELKKQPPLNIEEILQKV